MSVETEYPRISEEFAGTETIPIDPANELSMLDPRCLAIDQLTNEIYIGQKHQLEEVGSVMTIRIEEQTAKCVHVISSGLVKPSGIAFTDSSIFVSDGHTNRIVSYSKSGEILGETWEANNMEFCCPSSLRCYLDTIYVCDWGNARITAFDTELNFLFESRREEFNRPIDIAIHANCVFVVSQKPFMISVFSLEGNFITVFVFKLPKFKCIKSFAIDSTGNIVFSSFIHRFLYFLNLEYGEIAEINLFDIFSFNPGVIAILNQDKIISLYNSGVQIFNIF